MHKSVFIFLVLLPAIAFAQRDTSIRNTDWEYAIQHDPAFEIDTDYVDTNWGNFTVEFVEGSDSGSMAGGYPNFDYITYGDIDHDGIEEAVIVFYTGGTAGDCSYAIMKRFASGGVRMVTMGEMYKGFAEISNDTLHVTSSLYTPTMWEGNSYPQSKSEESYLLKDGKLFRVDSTALGVPDGAWSVTEDFYGLLQSREFKTAYDLHLAPEYKAQHPYNEWVKEYEDADSIEFEVDVEKSRPLNTTTKGIVPVSVVLYQGKKATEYEGICKIIWRNSDDAWQLSESKLNKVK
jgi:hypothetical protein